MPPYPANLCPLSSAVEFAGFGEDFGQAIGEPIEVMSGMALRQRATEHLECMLSKQQGINDAIQPGTRCDDGCFRLRRQMPGLRAGQMELALQIGRSDLDVAHRHLRIDMAQ